MALALPFPRASQRTYLLSWPVGVDLTGATLTAALKYSLTDAAADAIALSTGDDPQLSLVVIDAVAAKATLTFLPGATSALPVGVFPWWQVVATLAGGEVYIFENHQGVLDLTPGPSLCGCHEVPPVPGISALIDDTASIALLPTMLSNVVLNRYDLTGLTGGTSVKLDGLSAATLAALQSGAKVELSLTGDIELQYRLRARPESEAEAAPFVILCDNDSARCWALTRVFRSGLPCTYNAGTTKWHKEWAVGADGSATNAIDATGFTIPV